MKTLYKLFIALSFLGLAACGSDSDSCSPCDSSANCDEGLVCGSDYGEAAYCVDPTTVTTCIVN